MRGLGHATHTLAELEVSAAAYDEIAGLMRAAGYDHVFGPGESENGSVIISMQGVGLSRKAPEEPKAAG